MQIITEVLGGTMGAASGSGAPAPCAPMVDPPLSLKLTTCHGSKYQKILVENTHN